MAGFENICDDFLLPSVYSPATDVVEDACRVVEEASKVVADANVVADACAFPSLQICPWFEL
jgi:hypothetical protein